MTDIKDESKPFNAGAFGLALLVVGCAISIFGISPIPVILNSVYSDLGNLPFREVFIIVGACMFFVGGITVLYKGGVRL